MISDKRSTTRGFVADNLNQSSRINASGLDWLKQCFDYCVIRETQLNMEDREAVDGFKEFDRICSKKAREIGVVST